MHSVSRGTVLPWILLGPEHVSELQQAEGRGGGEKRKLPARNQKSPSYPPVLLATYASRPSGVCDCAEAGWAEAGWPTLREKTSGGVICTSSCVGDCLFRLRTPSSHMAASSSLASWL